MFGRASFPKEIWLKDWKCFDKISSDNKDYLLPQFAYKYNLVSWLSSLGWRLSLSSSREEICQTYPDNYNFSHIYTLQSSLFRTHLG